ncbi:MAG: rRNA maturation RNase YbeY [Alphaproteobacteria bacterium]
MAVEIAIRIADPGWRTALPDVRARVRRAVRAALADVPDPGEAEMTVVLADDALLRDLNRTWRGKDKPTNVLSFADGGPAAPGARRARGDGGIARETTAAEAAAGGLALADHLAHLAVHGTRHLLGHDHERAREAEAMEALEVKALARIGIADPYRRAA